MELRFDVTVTPMDLKIQNEQEVAKAMAQAIWRKVVARLVSGHGSRGPLPTSKQGNPPLNRTGTMMRSINIGLRQRSNGNWESVVRCFGDRPPEENAAAKVARAKVKTKQLRAAVALGAALTFAAGGRIDPRILRKTPTKTGKMLKLSRVRVRAADTNASLAAILSVRPHDKRSINGSRGVYRVFERSDLYQQAAFDAARGVLRARLEAKGG